MDTHARTYVHVLVHTCIIILIVHECTLLYMYHFICQLTMTDEVPGLEEGDPELTKHSGLTVPRLGDGGGGRGGVDMPPGESPHLRSEHVTHTM